MNQETHPNPNEIFPLRGELGGPGGSAKAKIIAALVLTAVAVATVTVVLALYVVCTALRITATTAQIEVRLENWDEAPVSWNLTFCHGEADAQPLPVLQTGILNQQTTVLELKGLNPDTWYELWFYDQADPDQTEPVSRYRFCTGPGDGTPPATTPAPTQPPATTPAPTQPPATTPAPTQPPVTTPAPTEPPETTPAPTQPPPTEPESTQPPPVEPPAIPDPVAPVANVPVLDSYIAPDLEMGTTPGSYTVSFSFRLNDALPDRILVTDEMLTYSNFSLETGNQGPSQTEPSTLTRTFGPEDMVIDTAANTVTVTFAADDPYKAHNMTASLDYTLYNANGETAGIGTVTSEALELSPSYLYGMEADSASTWQTTINGEDLNLVLTIRDFQKGSLEYVLKELNIYADYSCADGSRGSYDLADLIAPPAIPTETDGTFTYSFTIPVNPGGWDSPVTEIFLSMDGYGDCVLEDVEMGIQSGTFCYGVVNPPLPDPVAPTADAPVLEEYLPPVVDNGGYTVRFSFPLNDGLPEGITITDTVTSYSNFGLDVGNQGPTTTTQSTITHTVAAADITVDETANTATVTYLAQDPYDAHSITATLDYTLLDAYGNEAGTGSVISPAYDVSPSYMYGMEVASANAWISTINPATNNADVTLTIRDFQQGSASYRLSELNIHIDYAGVDGRFASYALADLVTPPALPSVSGGIMTYSFTIPTNPDGWAIPAEVITIYMDAAGDCYLDGVAMGLPSETFDNYEFGDGVIPLGDPYNVEPPTLNLTEEFKTMLKDVLGLEVGSMELFSPEVGGGTSLTDVPAGSTVYVDLYFTGTVIADGSLVPDVTASGDIVGLGINEMIVYAGDDGGYFSFEFIMPDRDVAASDIIIGDFTIETQGPAAGG